MRPGPILFLFFFLFPLQLTGQVAPAVIEHLATSEPDTHLLNLIRDSAFSYWGETNAESVIQLSKIGIDKARAIGETNREIDFNLYAGTHNDLMGEWRAAQMHFNQGIQLALEIENYARAGDFELNQGVSYYFRGLQDSALHHYLRANDYYLKSDEKGKLSKVYNNLAIIYKSKGDFENALDIYNKSILIKEELLDSAGLANSLQNKGILLSKLDRYDEAIDNCNAALALQKKIGTDEDLADVYSSLGSIYLEMGATEKALEALAESSIYFENNLNSAYAPISLTNYGQVLLTTEQFEKALYYLELAKEMAEEKDMKEVLLTNYRLQAEAHQKLGDYSKAYDFLEKGFIVKDTLTEETRIKSIEELQLKFDVAQKEADLKITNLQLAQRTNQRNWILAGIVLLLIAGLALYFGLSNKIKSEKKIALARTELHQQKLVQLEQERKLSNIKAVIEGEEKERSRIAGELHDSLGGLLTTVKAHFNELPKPKGENGLFQKTAEIIDEACVEVRRISHNMMPRALTVTGLKGAVEDLASHISDNGIETQLEIIGLEDPSINVQKVMVFRILQELTQNMLKHAAAKNVFIQLMEHKEGLHIIFEDDGKGFNLTEASTKKSLGLNSLENRVRFLEGSIMIDSVPNQGTTTTIDIPRRR